MADSENRTNPNSPYATHSSPSASNGVHKNNTENSGQSQRNEIKDKAKQTANELKEEARQRATSTMEQQKRMLADQTGKLATAIYRMAEELDNQGQPYFSGYANNIARCTDTLSERLRERDIKTLVTQIEGYTRRQPSLFIAGAVAVGFLFTRFMRSSSEHRRDDRSTSVN